MYLRSLTIILVSLLLSSGCGKPPMMSVNGTVKLDGKTVPHCKIGFFPDTEEFNPDRHGYGYGISDNEGKFEIQHPQGEKGIYAGKYKVTFEAWVNKKGQPIPADAKPSEVEGGVKNLFPDLFAEPSRTTQKVEVKAGANVFDFTISSK